MLFVDFPGKAGSFPLAWPSPLHLQERMFETGVSLMKGSLAEHVVFSSPAFVHFALEALEADLPVASRTVQVNNSIRTVLFTSGFKLQCGR